MSTNPIVAFFGGMFASKPNGNAYLPDVFPIEIASSTFVETDVETIYSKILADVIERTEGIPEKTQHALWDSCLSTEAPEGLVTLLSKAMSSKGDLYLVYKDEVLRKASAEEQDAIRAESKEGKPKTGIYVTFKDFKRTEMVKLYSLVEYCVIASLYKGVNLSKAIQYKISDLRKSVSLADSIKARDQAAEIATALKQGKDVYMDGEDSITSHSPDLAATKETVEFLDAKRCFYLGLPRSYITGLMAGGLGDSGNADAKAIERGLKAYFVSIVKPVIDALFNAKVTFKPSDISQVGLAFEAIKTFELAGDDLVSKQKKVQVIDRLLGV